ncbi:MAG: hypothetical protein HXX18_01250 [Bacteroidetes bacterium]|nr:hypothetical protein [Bacteroidota bacterium]
MSFFEIVIDKQVTNGDISFWLEVSKTLISGIIVGITIAIIGYIIWKKQNIYSKKFEVYINLTSSLDEIYRVAFNSIIPYNINSLKVFFNMNQNFLHELQKNKMLFVLFFGEKYNDKIEYFIDIINIIETVKITIINENMIAQHLVDPIDYTPEILNMHRQYVMDTMATYLQEMKAVSKSFKKYVI